MGRRSERREDPQPDSWRGSFQGADGLLAEEVADDVHWVRRWGYTSQAQMSALRQGGIDGLRDRVQNPNIGYRRRREYAPIGGLFRPPSACGWPDETLNLLPEVLLRFGVPAKAQSRQGAKKRHLCRHVGLKMTGKSATGKCSCHPSSCQPLAPIRPRFPDGLPIRPTAICWILFGRFVAASTTIFVTSLSVIFDSFAFSFLRLCGFAPLRESPSGKSGHCPLPGRVVVCHWPLSCRLWNSSDRQHHVPLRTRLVAKSHTRDAQQIAINLLTPHYLNYYVFIMPACGSLAQPLAPAGSFEQLDRALSGKPVPHPGRDDLLTNVFRDGGVFCLHKPRNAHTGWKACRLLGSVMAHTAHRTCGIAQRINVDCTFHHQKMGYEVGTRAPSGTKGPIVRPPSQHGRERSGRGRPHYQLSAALERLGIGSLH